jgi:hypothetical protein
MNAAFFQCTRCFLYALDFVHRKNIVCLTGSFEGLTSLYDTAKLPLGHIGARETHNDVGDSETASRNTERDFTEAESDLGDTENDLAETANDLGAAENDLAETVKDLGDYEPVKEQDIPDIVLEDMDELGEWHMR